MPHAAGDVQQLRPRNGAMVTVDLPGIKKSNAQIAEEINGLDPDTVNLSLDDGTPNDETWAVVSKHLMTIKHLRLSGGWDEMLNDKLPLHWPLERLLIDSSGGELVQYPWITKGRVKHLILWLTCNLRFDGPTSDELFRRHYEAVERGEKEEEGFKRDDGRFVEIVNLLQLVDEDRQKRWSEKARSAVDKE
ncbi:MAG: hypothetical protein Q9213_001215 [Squamulea squamosa]